LECRERRQTSASVKRYILMTINDQSDNGIIVSKRDDDDEDEDDSEDDSDVDDDDNE
jgi:hypothetical protein